MSAMPPALRFLLLTFAGWVNRKQQKVISSATDDAVLTGPVKCRERQGGVLKFNYREAA